MEHAFCGTYSVQVETYDCHKEEEKLHPMFFYIRKAKVSLLILNTHQDLLTFNSPLQLHGKNSQSFLYRASL